MLHHAYAVWVGFGLTLAATVALGEPSSNRRTPLVQAIQRVRPAVVNIHSQKLVPVSGSTVTGASPSRMSGMGTGVIIDERGYIVTNHHVIEDVSSLRITLVDGATYAGEIVAHDPPTDIAVIRIRPLSPLSVMPMGSSEDLMQGETVVAIGNAYGYEHTITSGIISELHRDVRLSENQAYNDLIQTDASINPGNSGGPLINADGEMIGLNVAIRAGAQGIGFAIPVKDVERVVARLLRDRPNAGVWLGAITRSANLNDRSRGRLIVRRVEDNSPAARAGVAVGDRLVSLGGRNLDLEYDLERALIDRVPDEQLELVLERNGSELRLSVALTATNQARQSPVQFVARRLGLKLGSGPSTVQIKQVSPQLRGGLSVLDVSVGSIADQAGLKSGDILVGLHEWEMLTLDHVLYVLKQPILRKDSPVKYTIIRRGTLQEGWITLAGNEEE